MPGKKKIFIIFLRSLKKIIKFFKTSGLKNYYIYIKIRLALKNFIVIKFFNCLQSLIYKILIFISKFTACFSIACVLPFCLQPSSFLSFVEINRLASYSQININRKNKGRHKQTRVVSLPCSHYKIFKYIMAG